MVDVVAEGSVDVCKARAEEVVVQALYVVIIIFCGIHLLVFNALFLVR